MIDFSTAYNIGKQKEEDYLFASKKNTNVFLPFSGVNIVFIETDIYAGNINQAICENVIGFDYADCNRHSDTTEDYNEKMKKLGYDSRYFFELTKECMHESYGAIIASILPTPGVANEKYPNYPVFNSVGLFFKDTLNLTNMETIYILSTGIIKKYNGNILSIGQFKKE